jgi:zinc transporter ZupT
MSKGKTFWYGVLSGVVEPVAAALTVVAANAVVPILPYMLSFAAGAMMYVVVEELIPEMSEGKHSKHRNDLLCGRLCTYDDFRCGAGMNGAIDRKKLMA